MASQSGEAGGMKPVHKAQKQTRGQHPTQAILTQSQHKNQTLTPREDQNQSSSSHSHLAQPTCYPSHASLRPSKSVGLRLYPDSKIHVEFSDCTFVLTIHEMSTYLPNLYSRVLNNDFAGGDARGFLVEPKPNEGVKAALYLPRLSRQFDKIQLYLRGLPLDMLIHPDSPREASLLWAEALHYGFDALAKHIFMATRLIWEKENNIRPLPISSTEMGSGGVDIFPYSYVRDSKNIPWVRGRPLPVNLRTIFATLVIEQRTYNKEVDQLTTNPVWLLSCRSCTPWDNSLPLRFEMTPYLPVRVRVAKTDTTFAIPDIESDRANLAQSIAEIALDQFEANLVLFRVDMIEKADVGGKTRRQKFDASGTRRDGETHLYFFKAKFHHEQRVTTGDGRVAVTSTFHVSVPLPTNEEKKKTNEFIVDAHSIKCAIEHPSSHDALVEAMEGLRWE